MEIHADSLSGRAPCNQYAASLAAENGRFALSAVRVTRMACPRLEEEERFFGALERVRSYRRDGAALLLLDDAGESALRLESE
jgi:putative lipoprotein